MGEHEATGDSDASVEVGEARNHRSDVISDEVVVAAEPRLVDGVFSAEQLEGEVADDRHFTA